MYKAQNYLVIMSEIAPEHLDAGPGIQLARQTDRESVCVHFFAIFISLYIY